MTMAVVGMILATSLLVYLVAVMVRPEWF